MENWKIVKMRKKTMSRSEERLCKSIIRGLVKRNHEKHAMLADVGEKQEQDVIARSCRGMQYAIGADLLA